ncbi:MAG: protein-L-isoaspartate O-methyltransferase, partial [Gammaproteobacteria bacterium]|nr:protein-L-isoaspartate O-methyltransferase [Gammaproteobacteria bacterium]
MTDQNIFREVHIKLINHLIKIGISNKKVLDVLSLIPRHLFVEPALQKRAYDDDALPIG